jgi:hypothetical protein
VRLLPLVKGQSSTPASGGGRTRLAGDPPGGDDAGDPPAAVEAGDARRPQLRADGERRRGPPADPQA